MNNSLLKELCLVNGISGDENRVRDIIISEGTTNIKPVYKANEDTAYTVIHYQMDIDGVHYTEFERENLTGTTDSTITPEVKTYEGFRSPSTQTTTIKGDGTTVVEYLYTRNSYDFNYSSTENIDLNNIISRIN